ncbi:MAG: non-heme iron oxygenase ferredoxin subunit [Chloroflexi bacterium]|nr:non-heme iron oxygenase ferredoxin subunit [Chloroflexota bacterium]
MAEYVTVTTTRQLRPGDMLRAIVDDVPVCVYNVGGDYYATQDTCTHAEASLSEGDLSGDVVTCPLHGAEFNVRTGAVLCFPATQPLATFAVKVDDGRVMVQVER